VNRQVWIGLIAADAVLLALALWQGANWVINTQIAFVTSAMVMVASLQAHARMVRRRIEAGEIPTGTDRDTIDTLEDPFDLYGEEEEGIVEPDDIRATIRSEKQRLAQQRRTPMEAIRDARASLSPMRMIAYALLLGGFFALTNRHLFDPIPYLIGMTVPIVVIVIALAYTQKEKR